MITPVWWEGSQLKLLDQTRLPAEERVLSLSRVEEVAEAIRRLAVRGAPAIGVAASYGLVLGVQGARSTDELTERFDQACELLKGTRPTAVNLQWALERQRHVFDGALAQNASPEEIVRALLEEAHKICREDIEANRRLGEHGAQLLPEGTRVRVLTHCNAGALATAGYGTALGVIRAAWAQGKLEKVWVDETRPLLQGARLTAWELQREGIPYEIVVDGAAGALISRGLVDAVITGADRVAANGDVANKIGTYALAVLARRHGIPFYVALPTSTIDPEIPNGGAIPIEERDPEEVLTVLGCRVAPQGASARNYAFDVTPHELVAALITEVGVLRPPFGESIRWALSHPEAVYRHV